MEQRPEELENFADLSRQLTAIMERRQARVEENLRLMAALHQQVAVTISELAQDQRASDEILQKMVQAVAVIQADIIRIDETHG